MGYVDKRSSGCHQGEGSAVYGGQAGWLCVGKRTDSPPKASSVGVRGRKWLNPPRLCLPLPELTGLKSVPFLEQAKGAGTWATPFQESPNSELTPHFETAHLFYLGA